MTPSIHRILEVVSAAYGVGIPIILGDRRFSWVAWPRMVAAHLAYQRMTGREVDVALCYGKGTSASAHQAVIERMSIDPGFARVVEWLEEACNV